MIKEIKLINFQSHKESTLKLHSGVNAIIGNSDSGKTAIIRGLNWVFNNKPQGDAFRSNWGGDTCVSAAFDNCHIRRFKGDENKYTLDDETDFKAMKSEVPEELVTLMNVNDVNLQQQLDSPFLLSASSGEVAKTLNRIANLSDIDVAMSRAKKKVADANDEIRTLENAIAETNEQIKAFDDLDYLEKTVLVLEKYEEKGILLDDQIQQISQILVKVAKLSNEQVKLEHVLKGESLVTQGLVLIEQAKAKEEKISSLERLLKIIKTKTDRKEELEEEIERKEREYKKLFPNICPLCEQGV